MHCSRVLRMYTHIVLMLQPGQLLSWKGKLSAMSSSLMNAFYCPIRRHTMHVTLYNMYAVYILFEGKCGTIYSPSGG
jgi:hypothetical protein